jgi:DNA (cytosine-5)-methyltransferase 3A
MNVLSLFDGMSCGQIALKKLGVPVKNYFASEIDKFAIKVAKANFPDMVHLGDVQNVKTSGQYLLDEFDCGHKIDLLIGGSPCQGFSFAGKQLNFEDPRSQLFFEYIRLLKALKPKYFMLENVKMSKQSQQIITEYLGVEPVEINSNLVSAQNRRRLYWTNIPVDGLPEDKGTVLADILEDGYTDREKSYCLDASYYKGGGASNVRLYFEKSRRQIVFGSGMNVIGTATDIKGRESIRRVYGVDGKAPTLLATTGGNTQPKVAVKGARIVNRRLDENGTRKDYDRTIEPVARLELRKDDKGGCLTTVQKDSVLAFPKILQRARGFNKGGLKALDGKTPTISTSAWEHNNHLTLDEGTTWRKLSPVECERLQTVPDGYTDHVSNTQRYKMLGNGWTVDVVKHLFKGLQE